MFAEPVGFDRQQLVATLSWHWGLSVTSIRYEPVGFGSHHFVVADAAGADWFVNVDELATKDPDTDLAFDRLDRALRTAASLRDAGLEFVHAPTPGRDGGLLARTADYAVWLHVYLTGTSEPYGAIASDPDRCRLLGMLGRMHAAGRQISPDLPPRETLAIPVRRQFFLALGQLEQPWTVGPYSERARQALFNHAEQIHAAFTRYDALVPAVAAGSDSWVVTHGEPHAANLMRIDGDALVLIDWDTAALAPRERDLWMVEPRDDADKAAYACAGGTTEIDPLAMELYRTLWTLSELTLYTADFRAPHAEDANTRVAWDAFLSELPTR